MKFRIGETVVRAEEVVDEKIDRPFADVECQRCGEKTDPTISDFCDRCDRELDADEMEFGIYVGHVRPQLN